jgi:hypothetical protein
VANGMDRIAAIGNGQVPDVVSLAWKTLANYEHSHHRRRDHP